MEKILGIETSCDECSVSVVESNFKHSEKINVRSLATFSQTKLHETFGGVVPELASRNHLETINEMIQKALADAKIKAQDLSAIAVTNRPGLLGALLVGLSAGKAMAYALKKPLIPVHHLEGHVASLFLDQDVDLKLPLLAAIVSGGHTHLLVIKEHPEHWGNDFLKSSLVGKSLDDAAGEAFDKTAKCLGFPYPGGIFIDQKSQDGNPAAFHFPRGLPQNTNLDFSFSGLKTAVAQHVEKLKKQGPIEPLIPDLAASIQEAIVDVLLKKIFNAAEKYQCASVAIVGGVSANRRLRTRLTQESPLPVLFPLLKYTTDNGAMIAAAGAFRFKQGQFLEKKDYLKITAFATADF